MEKHIRNTHLAREYMEEECVPSGAQDGTRPLEKKPKKRKKNDSASQPDTKPTKRRKKNNGTSDAKELNWDERALGQLVGSGIRSSYLLSMHRCPFCRVELRNSDHYFGHVGDHLESIALLSAW